MHEISRKPAHTVAELASARQHQENWPIIMERAVEGNGGPLANESFAVRARRPGTSMYNL